MRLARLIAVLIPLLAHGQNISSSLSGVVADASGARAAGAEATLTSQQGFLRTTRTNGEGYFAFPDLTAGVYTLSVSAPGFKKYVQSQIELSSSDQRSLPTIKLQVGEVTESVTVTAEVAPVQLGSSERAGTLTTDDLQTLALRGRDFMDAVGLLPGVVDTADSREVSNATSSQGIYVAGARNSANNVTVDGMNNQDTTVNSSLSNVLPMDAIGEVKVLMSNYAAEYGRSSGASINIITRGGSKQFHGSAGWYHRHESYAANEWFNNTNGVPKPRYRYNIPGYTIGGPVYIPGLWNTDRTKLFFFFSQEFQRQLQEYGTRQVTVPTELERTGDFSRTFDVNGRVVQIQDPLNNRLQFPGNVIPSNRIDPVGRKILDLFPSPNFVDSNPSNRYQWNYIAAQSGQVLRQTEVMRFDFSPRQNSQFNVRLIVGHDKQHPPYGSWVNGPNNFPLTTVFFDRPSGGATLRNTTTLTPTLFSEFTFGYNMFQNHYWPENPERVTRQGTGINVPQWNPKLNPDGYLPNMTFTSVPNFANPSMANPRYDETLTAYSLVENLSKIHGTHTTKFGFYMERDNSDVVANALVRGALSFNRNTTNPLDTNYAYSNALTGNYYSYSEATARPHSNLIYWNFEGYVQDAWRVTPRLTLDYGVRFYHNMPAYDSRGNSATFARELWNPATAPVLLYPAYDANRVKVALDPVTGRTFNQALIGTYAPGLGDPANGMAVGGTKSVPKGFYTVAPISVAPRFGFAWDPFGRSRTAIRGGGGVFYDRVMTNQVRRLQINPPAVYTPAVYYGTLASLAQTSGQGILAPSGNMTALSGQQHIPVTYNYSFGVQQQIGATMIVDVSYVGSMARHLSWTRNINPVPIGATQLEISPWNRDPTTTSALSAIFLRPYLGLGDITQYEFAGTSNYNSFQLSFNRRLRDGVMFGLAYTFSKTLGTADSDTTAISPFFSPRERNYGLLGFDRSHVLSLRYTWILPKPGKKLGNRALGVAADGWEIAGTTRMTTGAPYTPGYTLVSGMDVTGTPSESARLDVVNPTAEPKQRFGAPPKYTFGNAGASTLRGPGVNNWDISLYRTIRVRERFTTQLRLETYNSFNHPQWRTLNTTARFDAQNNQIDASFLDPRTSRGPRRVQLAVRVNW